MVLKKHVRVRCPFLICRTLPFNFKIGPELSNCVKENTFWKVNFWYQWIIQCNTDSCYEHMAGNVNIYLYGCVRLSVPQCVVCLCIMCLKHIKVFLVLRYQGSTWIHNIIKWNNIKCGTITHSVKEKRHQKQQWKWRLETTGKSGWTKFLKGGIDNIGGS